MSGIGLYWCIVECLYENNGYLDLDQINLLAYELRVEKKLIEDIIDNYDLFKKNKKSFYSKSVLQRLEKINEISRKNKENANKRWANKKQERPKTDSNATALQSEYKENKIKENKNKINKTKTATAIAVAPELEPAWQAFIEMRKKMRKPMTEYAMEITIKKLETLAPSDTITQKKILEQSVERSWQSVYELKEKGGVNNGRNEKPFKPSDW